MTRYLADKSALELARRDATAKQRLEYLFTERRVLTCAIVDLEILYSARTASDWAEIRAERATGFGRLDLTEAIFDRAVEVQGGLAAQSRHRAPSIPDLMVAACAETHGVAVLHYDKDFEIIAAFTGQRVEWVRPRTQS